MKRTLKKLLTILVLLSMVISTVMISPISVFAANTTYYVDSVSGSDSNNGTSTSTPWKTLSKVNTITFGAGDQILFKCGTTITGHLQPKGSGSSASPIIISSYGTGAKPIIDGAGAASTIQLDNVQYYEISNIEIMNQAAVGTDRIGLYLTAKDVGTLNHIYVTNVYFHDIVSRAPNYTPGSNESAGSFTGGIVGKISGSTTPTRYNDVKITGCTFLRCDRNVFYFFYSPWYNNSTVGMSGGAGAMFNSTNVVFSNNTATDTPGTGMCLCACDGALLEHNVMNNCQYNVASNIAGVAASTWASNDCIYQYNEIYNTHGTADGQAMDNDGGCQRIIFQYNYSHNNNGGFYLSCSGSDCKVYDGIFRYNISQNDLNGIFDMRANSFRGLIYNNTVYNGSGYNTNMFRIDTDSTYGTATFSNNIFENHGTSIAANKGSFTWKNNTFYGNFSSTPTDTAKLTTNPLFVSPGTAGTGLTSTTGYILQSSSPCINSGVTITSNGGKDYAGNTLYNGAADRGAYEFQGTPTSPTPGIPTPTPTPSPTPVATIVTLTSYFNADGFSYDTARNNGNLDQSGYTYSADLTNATPTFNGVQYQFGPFTNGSNNTVNCNAQTITIPNNTYNTLRILGTGTAGDQSGTFTVNYSDSTTSTVNLFFPDWCTGTGVVEQSMAHRHSSTADSAQTVKIYEMTITPTAGKTVVSLKLPTNTAMHIFALDAVR